MVSKMTFTIEIPIIGAMLLEVSGEWEPISPEGDVAEIKIINEIVPIVRNPGGLGSAYKMQEFNASANIIMEQDQEFTERLIDALEERGGY